MKEWLCGNAPRRNASRWFARMHSTTTSGSTDAAFHRWLRRDQRNEEEFQRNERLWSLLGQLRDDPELMELARTSPSPSARRQAAARSWTRWGMAAAVTALALASAFWWLAPALHGRPGRIEEREFVTGTGEQRAVTLADGSRIVLNTATRLRERFTRRRRWFDLEQGEAAFFVHHDASWPLLVVAGGTRTRDIGTAFDVYHVAGRTSISVLAGQVLVDALSGGGRYRGVSLTGGQATTYTAAAGLGPVRPADVSRILAWQSHRVEFHNETLAAAVSDFNRYVPVRILIGAPSLGRIRVSGVFRCNDVAAFVRALHGTFGIRAETRGKAVLLLPAEQQPRDGARSNGGRRF